MYAPLYIKTNNSLLESMIRINELVKYAKDNNIKALTITDNRMYGVMEFYKACISNDIKPIIGLEVSYKDNIFVLYAKNNDGYKNLMKLSTIISSGSLNDKDLINYKSDLICIIPFTSEPILDELTTIYDEIFRSYKNKTERNNMPGDNLLYMNETLYINKEDSTYLPYLYGIKEGTMVSNIRLDKDNNFILNEDILKKHFSDDMKNNYYIVENCNVTISHTPDLLPKFKCPDNLDSFSYLKRLCINGLKRIFKDEVPNNYKERLKYELDIINKMGFCNYFLVVQDFINYAKNNDIYRSR